MTNKDALVEILNNVKIFSLEDGLGRFLLHELGHENIERIAQAVRKKRHLCGEWTDLIGEGKLQCDNCGQEREELNEGLLCDYALPLGS